mgnify:FL=1
MAGCRVQESGEGHACCCTAHGGQGHLLGCREIWASCSGVLRPGPSAIHGLECLRGSHNWLPHYFLLQSPLTKRFAHCSFAASRSLKPDVHFVPFWNTTSRGREDIYDVVQVRLGLWLDVYGSSVWPLCNASTHTAGPPTLRATTMCVPGCASEVQRPLPVWEALWIAVSHRPCDTRIPCIRRRSNT